MPPYVPELSQCPAEPETQLGLSPFERPPQSRPEVVVFGLQLLQATLLMCSPQLVRGAVGQRQVVPRVPIANPLGFPAFLQTLLSVLPYRLQHPVTQRPFAARLAHHPPL